MDKRTQMQSIKSTLYYSITGALLIPITMFGYQIRRQTDVPKKIYVIELSAMIMNVVVGCLLAGFF